MVSRDAAPQDGVMSARHILEALECDVRSFVEQTTILARAFVVAAVAAALVMSATLAGCSADHAAAASVTAAA